MKNGYASPSSSPPTPSSPLPVSVGPDSHHYFFLSSPSPSPPFSPPPSTPTSAENLPLLHHKLFNNPSGAPSTFSLDQRDPNDLDDRSSCLKQLLEWFLLRCCSCCSMLSFNLPPPHKEAHEL